MNKALLGTVAFGLTLASLSGGVFAHYVQDRGLANVSAALQAAPVSAAPVESKTYTLRFFGDIMLGRLVAKSIRKNGNGSYSFPFAKISETIRSADFAFANLEGPISARGKNQGSKYSFRFSPLAAGALAEAGFEAVSIANNHIWDYGTVALLDTISLLKAQGILPVGAGKDSAEANTPKQFTARLSDGQVGLKLALLAYTPLYPATLSAGVDYAGVSRWNEKKIIEAIQKAKLDSDIIIVSLHWGTEYSSHASLDQKRIAHKFIDAGADLIIGSHPHVAQEYEAYNSGHIFYSLGNFVFDQDFSTETMQGAMAEVTVKDKKIISAHAIPIKINSAFQPELVSR